MEKLYGNLDLTILGTLVKQHPELVREVDFKDGKHKLLNIDVYQKQQADQYGNVATIKASCKKDQQKQKLNYYLANLKVSQYQNDNQHQQSSEKKQKPEKKDDLPF